MSLIYILCSESTYASAQQAGVYTVDSLANEGFIHASPAHQLTRVANKYYAHLPELLVLVVNEQAVQSEVKWEALSTPEPYPHIYGPLNLEAIMRTEHVSRMPDGNYEIYITD